MPGKEYYDCKHILKKTIAKTFASTRYYKILVILLLYNNVVYYCKTHSQNDDGQQQYLPWICTPIVPPNQGSRTR